MKLTYTYGKVKLTWFEEIFESVIVTEIDLGGKNHLDRYC
ncbi:Uncharacterised protein [Streptococcus pneumoniae]|nr:Uncharacterised protein [Streptococcus pneumoniae]